MKTKKDLFAWGIVIALFICSAAFYFFLPETIPSHWNWAGEIDGYMGRVGVFLMPSISFLVVLLMRFLPRLDPKYKNYASFEGAYRLIMLALVLFFAVMQGLIIYSAFFPRLLAIDRIMPLLTGGLFILIGKSMYEVRSNFFMGIRTPWTLSSDEVWQRTHHMGGRLWMIGGCLMALTALLPSLPRIILFFTIVALLALIPIIYSYFIFKQINRK